MCARPHQGKSNKHTAPGDTLTDFFSDTGSTPVSSTISPLPTIWQGGFFVALKGETPMQYQKTITLRDGTPCILRGTNSADAAQVLSIFNLTHAQTDFLLTYPDESRMTVEEEQQYLAKSADSTDSIEICAILDGRIVGTAGISAVGHWEKLRHRAEFGISIDKDYWGRGIGRALTLACIDCARTAGYSQLELDVVAENTAAQALYQSVGFAEYGRNPRGFRTRSGQWQELILMRMELN